MNKNKHIKPDESAPMAEEQNNNSDIFNADTLREGIIWSEILNRKY